jgi:HEXXH motif-containing protein
VIATHLLPEAAFFALAEGGGGPDTIGLLRNAQHSKHLMLLGAIADTATGTGPGPDAFRAGYELLTRVQAAAPATNAWLLGLPHLGSWAHDCLIRLDQGPTADFAYLACLAAAAAVHSGLPFELDVPVRDGRVRLPGLGSLLIAGEPAWTRLGCDGERVAVGGQWRLDRRLLTPDDGSGPACAQWSGTPLIAAAADGLTWDVLLETDDPYLDRYNLPMSAHLQADEVRRWRRRVQAAWEVLARHHRWAAEPMAIGVRVVVPLTVQRDTDLVSATAPAAFGAFATSWPPDPVTLAETLVHEFQHVKLGGLMDLVPLVSAATEPVYAPWRQDPRPVGGLLQGVYAHLGIARFWDGQRRVETDPDDVLRAQALFARWLPAIDQATATLLRTGSLTQRGTRFVSTLRDAGTGLASQAPAGHAGQIAAEAALDHWLTWQLRHTAIDGTAVAGLAAAYQRGDSFATQIPPRTWISEDTRKVDAALRSRLLTMRYLAPARYRELSADPTLALEEPDRLLVNGSADAAVQAYRQEIADAVDPRPDAWIGLALALHKLQPSPLQPAVATRLALMAEVHGHLGGRSDPLDLASWFA